MLQPRGEACVGASHATTVIVLADDRGCLRVANDRPFIANLLRAPIPMLLFKRLEHELKLFIILLVFLVS